MYQIDQKSNRIEALRIMRFSDLGFREREHLQEWLAANPEALGEELLIIQKEFDGFEDTRERLDLLALDKDGALVLIENKLDDSGRDVVWQALKYASYCSSLSKRQIVQVYQQYLDRYAPGEDAEQNLTDFFDGIEYQELTLNTGYDQRIIFVAANFRKEVTSTALWLINHKVRIQCIKATPYAMGEHVFLNLEQIVPVKEAEEYIIGMSDKANEEREEQNALPNRQKVRRRFWEQFIPQLRDAEFPVFGNAQPTLKSYLQHDFRTRGVRMRLEFKQSEVCIRVIFHRKAGLELYEKFDRKMFEQSLATPVVDKSTPGKAVRMVVSYTINEFSEENWPKCNQWLIDSLRDVINALDPQMNMLSIEY